MTAEAQKFSFLLVPDFSLGSYALAVEVLKQSNKVAGEPLFSWETLSPDGEPVEASNGTRLFVDGGILEAGKIDWLCLCAGTEPEAAVNDDLNEFLRYTERFGGTIGAMGAGIFHLARLGLLSRTKCTIHSEFYDGMVEEHPELDVEIGLYTIDGRRFTCAGGTAVLDLMMEFVGQRLGALQLDEVRFQLMFRRREEDAEFYRRSAMANRAHLFHPGIMQAVELIEKNIEHPLGRMELAKSCGMSIRQMERQFQNAFGTGPAKFYMARRLKRAHYLLKHTPMRVTQVAFACGFTSVSHFSKSFRDQFDMSPNSCRQERLADAYPENYAKNMIG